MFFTLFLLNLVHIDYRTAITRVLPTGAYVPLQGVCYTEEGSGVYGCCPVLLICISFSITVQTLLYL